MNIPPERIESLIASSQKIAAQAKEVNALREQIALAQAQMRASQRSNQRIRPASNGRRAIPGRQLNKKLQRSVFR
jgi:hypothetical protein